VVLRHRVPRLADPAEAEVARGRLGVARAERHPDEHDRDPRRPGGLGGAVGRLDHGLVAYALDDAVLEVHQQQDGAGVGHDASTVRRVRDTIISQNLSDWTD